MMKILFYNHTATVSGAERVLLLILSQLDRNEFTPLVLCPKGALQTMVEVKNVSCLTVEKLEARFTWRPDYLLRYLGSFFRVMRNVRKQVIQAAPDLIHANSIRAGLVMTAATIGCRVPVVWHLHDMLPRHLLSTAIRVVTLSSSRLRMLAVSQATAEKFRGLLLLPFAQRVPVKVILNCADTEKFQPNAASRKALRAEFGLAENTPVIGIIGQITKRKGQLGLLEAFASVVREIPTAILLVVGEPLFTAADEEYYQCLKRIAEELGIARQVHFSDARHDIPAVMQALDLLVVNSLAEPCGLVVLEGMASGLPVIATAVGGNPEMIYHAVSGWLVPAQDNQALAEAIIKLIQSPSLCQLLRKNSRLRVVEQFTVAAFMSALEDFYLWNNSGNPVATAPGTVPRAVASRVRRINYREP